MPIKQTTPPEAHELVAAGYRYIDVRTEGEFAVGHPEGAVNIPVVFPDPVTRQMAVNREFLPTVEKHFARDARLVLGCQSGGRSQRAAEILEAAGYTNVCNMQGGFGGARDQTGRVAVPGWQASGLPVETTAPPERTYSGLR